MAKFRLKIRVKYILFLLVLAQKILGIHSIFLKYTKYNRRFPLGIVKALQDHSLKSIDDIDKQHHH